jgi:hypothetical protein
LIGAIAILLFSSADPQVRDDSSRCLLVARRSRRDSGARRRNPILEATRPCLPYRHHDRDENRKHHDHDRPKNAALHVAVEFFPKVHFLTYLSSRRRPHRTFTGILSFRLGLATDQPHDDRAGDDPGSPRPAHRAYPEARAHAVGAKKCELCVGEPGWGRTSDLLIKSQLLYR